MGAFELSREERKKIQQIFRSDTDADKVRCAGALLLVADGQKIAVTARQFGVGRGTIYYWMRRYIETGSLADRQRTGRPSRKLQKAKDLLPKILAKPPIDFGYPGYIWTSRSLHKYFRIEQKFEVSTHTIRRALHKLGMSWQRPKFYLARESSTWRQAKGGSKEA